MPAIAADPAGGVHQVGPGAIPLLAAERDGGADAGERVPALGDDGEGRRLLHRADDAHPRRDALWTTAVIVAGAATMLVGAYRAVQETDLKRILAYSTLSALGVLTMLLGVGTRRPSSRRWVPGGACRLQGRVVPGRRGHRPRDRHARHLGARRDPASDADDGARRRRAAVSMAGVPLTLGFVGKDGTYESLLHGARVGPLATGAHGAREHLPRAGGTARWHAGHSAGTGGSRKRCHESVVGSCGCCRSSSPRAVAGGHRSVDPQCSALGGGDAQPPAHRWMSR